MSKTTILAFLSLLLFTSPLHTLAQTVPTFNPHSVITDNQLTDYTTMGVGEIDKFLKEQGSTLTNYIDPSVRMTIPQYIQTVAWTYRINPQYTLTLLQKEQSLITEPNPKQSQYDWATGYGCPDSGGCNPKYKGLANQTDWGAGGIRYYLDNPNKFTYQVGQTYKIDDQYVTINNDATRALYIYTPHLHGNELLYNLWQDWFSKENKKFIDGMLLQNTSDGGIWLIQNNQRRAFTSKSAFASRYSFDKVIPVEPAKLEFYEIGNPIQHANYSLLQTPDEKIYLLDNQTLRPIESDKVFRLLGLNPEEVIPIKDDEIKGYVLGASISMDSSYPTGALLQDKQTGGVYFVQNGIKHPIWTKQLMLLYYADKKLTPVSPEELAEIATGDPIKLQDGELVKTNTDSQVYFISNGLKLPIADEKTFLDKGFKWQNIITTDAKILNLHQTGEIIKI